MARIFARTEFRAVEDDGMEFSIVTRIESLAEGNGTEYAHFVTTTPDSDPDEIGDLWFGVQAGYEKNAYTETRAFAQHWNAVQDFAETHFDICEISEMVQVTTYGY